MTDILTSLAQTFVNHGAPTIGTLFGSAIGGPVGAAMGGMAGKMLAEVATRLGTPATPEAVTAAILTRPDATEVVRTLEAELPTLLPLWQAQLAMAREAQTAEIERGFNSWNWRRNIAHYTAWGLTGGLGTAAGVAAYSGNAGAAALASLFGTAVSLTMAWLAVNSGGKAVTDFAEKWKAR